MKKNYLLIILVSAILGIFIGSMMKDYEQKENTYLSKDSLAKKEIKITEKSIKNLRKEKENLDKEINYLKKEYEDADKIREVESLKEYLSYTNVEGKGLVIKLDALNEEIGNISNFVDYNKILINIINELKINGGSFISINEQRINQYSEIVLAGNHININSVPIAPPYEIKCIGNIDKISNYIDKESNYLKNIQNNYPIKVQFKINGKVSMNKMSVPNKLKRLEGE